MPKWLNTDMKELLKQHINSQAVGLVIIGAIVGVMCYRLWAVPPATPRPVRDQNESYALINPLLFYNNPSDPNVYKVVLNKAQKQIDEFKKQDKQGTASIYLKDLNSGTWAGLNSAEQYNPASLLKVVVMIAYFKEAEANPSLMYRSLAYTTAIKNAYANIPYEQGTSLVLGRSYTVKDLVERMIIRSDNGATYTLLASINTSQLDGVFTALGVENPTTKGRDYTISAGRYSYFFRILYNATYLDRDDSERALELLSQSDFNDGLVAGLPEGITTAHKFGENTITDSKGTITQVELHDCGIIYYPRDNPYLLCIMTRGTELNSLKALIKDISNIVYTDRANN
jgi:beta-lactamase class A